MEWISVKDRLPKKYDTVLLYDGIRINIVDYLDKWIDPDGWTDELEVSHWMPVPDPPKTQQHNGSD